MTRSVMALFFREIRTRFGKYQLGYAWAVIEPMSTVLVMVVVFSVLGRVDYPGLSFPVFLATGVSLNSMFVDITNRSIKAMEANSTLFNYRAVRPIDTVISRTLLELVLHATVYVVLIGLYLAIGGSFQISDLPLLILVFFLLAVFSCGVGILFMLVTDIYPDAERVLPLLTRPLFFISGVFFSIQSVPKDYWPLLLWNPIFHAIELARVAVGNGYEDEGVSLGYLAMAAMATLTVSMALYRRREQKMRLR